MKLLRILALLVFLSFSKTAHGEDAELRIGVIASLTGFAAPYGKAVVEGAQVAVAKLAKSNVKVRLIIEDDRSETRGAATAYQKLKDIDKIQALIGGSWWVNGIVKTVERDPIPFISCETLYNKDFIKGKNYFSLAGDLRDWIKSLVPLIKEKQWNTIVMVRFVSGFADTLEAELRVAFAPPDRKFLAALEYSDIEMTGASTLAARTVALKPDVVFVDSQPQTFAIFVRELEKLKADNIVVLTHSVADDAAKQRLFDIGKYEGRLYFLRRSSYNSELLKDFQALSTVEPQLNADLGYYAVRLAVEAIKSGTDPVATLRAGLVVDGIQFSFDENNVSHTVVQEVYGVRDGQVIKVSK
ncbi:MAG: ABC transporter substrate-binding protein [Deltaproteobacteria bacterium]|nr:ABC transporter substrate-binding protein [Deltaproteobacteria bacterium]